MSAVGGPRAVPAGAGLFELPPELAIDTDVARRVILEFIRGQLKQAGFERAVVGLSGGIDSALVACLVAEAMGPERLLCVMLPYRTSASASRADAEVIEITANFYRRIGIDDITVKLNSIGRQECRDRYLNPLFG